MPSIEAAGRAGATLFWQSGPIWANVGTISSVITMSMVEGTPHCAGSSGVKVKVKVPATAVLMVAGFQIPVMPSIEAAGRAGATLFWQRGPIWAKVGTISSVITMSMVVGTPHWSGSSGVKVKVKVPAMAVLMVTGFQVPVMPSREAAGRAGATLFWQRGPICAKAGVISSLINITISTGIPHCAGSSGVKVKVKVPVTAVLMVAGFQEPVMPLSEISGRVGAVLFWQSGPICANAGVTSSSTVTSRVAVVAHCPASGVKVNVNVPAARVLMLAGFQVPVIPLTEVSGTVGAVLFWQSGPMGSKAGMVSGSTVMMISPAVASQPLASVMV
ncbi:hypothetical protein DSECCO2_632680 [anaerobic digester metagenome]